MEVDGPTLARTEFHGIHVDPAELAISVPELTELCEVDKQYPATTWSNRDEKKILQLHFEEWISSRSNITWNDFIAFFV